METAEKRLEREQMERFRAEQRHQHEQEQAEEQEEQEQQEELGRRQQEERDQGERRLCVYVRRAPHLQRTLIAPRTPRVRASPSASTGSAGTTSHPPASLPP